MNKPFIANIKKELELKQRFLEGPLVFTEEQKEQIRNFKEKKTK